MSLGSKSNDKYNFLLAVSSHEIMHYKFTKEKIIVKVFKQFSLETINNIDEKALCNTLFVLDNHVSHVSNDIINMVNKKKVENFVFSQFNF